MSFQLAAFIEDNALLVEFGLRNELDVDIYVAQFEPTREWPPTRRGYVYVHREERLLALYFGTVPSPPGVCLYQEVVFYTERLRPGETLTQSIRLPLPIAEHGKLDEANPAAPHEVVHVDRLRCTVCYTRKERRLKINEVKPGSDLYQVWYGKAEEATTTVHLLHPVAALRRSDHFDRPFDPARDIMRAPTR